MGTPPFIHPQACVESPSIGDGTRIWAHAHVMATAIIGRDCNLGEGVFIEDGATLGNGITVKNGVSIWDGITIEDFAFIGPNAVFTNDKWPRSPRLPAVHDRYEQSATWLTQTRIGKGATIGANATVICGVTVGAYAMVAAGSIVTRDVPPYALVVGSPAKVVGRVCECGQRHLATTGPCPCGRDIPTVHIPYNPPGVYIHPLALMESNDVGSGTRIWAYAHVMPDVTIGRDCNICDHCFIESGAVIGRGVTVKTHVAVGEGVTIKDGVFVGPHVVFTNDLRPRSPRLPVTGDRYKAKEHWLKPTLVEEGATLGAGVVVSCGITIGAWSFAAAGAVLLQDVAPFTFVMGNPARPVGYVCACGASLALEDGRAVCPECGRSYRLEDRRLVPEQPITCWES